VAQDVILSEPDCGTKQGITVSALIEGGEVIQTLEDRIFADAWPRRSRTRSRMR